MSPCNMDTALKLIALRYFCHHLEKALKHDLVLANIRGKDKFQRAVKIFEILKKTEFADDPDVIWAGSILDAYRMWMTGGKKNFRENLNSLKNAPLPNNIFKDVIYNRRSVRFWDNNKVPVKIINDIIEMATMAPSSCNRQPWKFVVVTNSNKSPKDHGATNKTILAKAPHIIYIAVDERLFPEKYAPAVDAGIAAENSLLAIEHFGLAGCVMYQAEMVNQKKLRTMLELKSYYYIYLAITFGYPAEICKRPARTTARRVTRFLKMDTDYLSKTIR